jgi:hypothetical protein
LVASLDSNLAYKGLEYPFDAPEKETVAAFAPSIKLALEDNKVAASVNFAGLAVD